MPLSSLIVTLTVAASAPAAAEATPAPGPRFAVAVEGGASAMDPALHAAAEFSVSLGRPRLLLRAEWNPWITLLQPSSPVNRGVANFGVGAELRYFGDRMRSAILVGASVLLFQSAFDPPGTFGPYLGIVPTSFRIPVGERLTVRVDPLSLYVLAPSLNSIPLIALQYRHSVGVELAF